MRVIVCILAIGCIVVAESRVLSYKTRPPKKYVVNLDLPEEKRWIQVVQDHRELIQDAKKVITALIPEVLVSLVEEIGADIEQYIKAPYAGEMKGISEAINMTIGDVVLVNIIYDVSAFCTSIVSQDVHGQIWHSRNLDYSFAGMLENITVAVDFQKSGKTVYSAVTYAGYIGILSGQKPNGFTITVDERDQGNALENLLVGILDHKTVPTTFLVRNTLAYEADYSSAVKRLSSGVTTAPVYFIIGGMLPGEGAIITKDRLRADDIWTLNQTTEKWFVVETNYDHWTTPPPGDDRRDPAIKAMKSVGQGDITVQNLFKVMTTPPVLNNHTTYTVIMSAAKPDLMQTWIWGSIDGL